MNGIRTMTEVAVPMRDGLNLAVNIFLPDAPGKYPCIMTFTSFGKDANWGPQHDGWGFAYEPWSPSVTGSAVFEANDPEFWCRYGYALMVVDPRGFSHSPGLQAHGEIDGAPGEFAIMAEGRWARDQYDTIEWAAGQEWSNGNIGLSGVSLLAFSQWRIAGLKPPHLKCINPWEGMTDYHRDCMAPGGVQESKFTIPTGEFCHKMAGVETSWPAPENEDPPKTELMAEDDFLEMIDLPALICGNWTDHGCHTRGTFRAFRKISSEQKWLFTHGRQKWATFYSSEARTFRMLFFDHFLKGTDDRILEIPRVSLMVMEDVDTYQTRWATDYPVPEAKLTTLYPDASSGKLVREKPAAESKITYEAFGEHAVFEYVFERDTELIGSSALKLNVSTDESDDMDLFVTFRKFDKNGKQCCLDGWITPRIQPIALGWLRLSLRELDPAHSIPNEPYLKHVIGPGSKVTPGEIVSCDIPVLPTSILFRKGDMLRVEIAGEYRSGEKLETQGFKYEFSMNKGKHTIYTGGDSAAQLILPLHEL